MFLLEAHDVYFNVIVISADRNNVKHNANVNLIGINNVEFSIITK